MKREYDLYNIKSNDFAYKLENILQNNKIIIDILVFIKGKRQWQKKK